MTPADEEYLKKCLKILRGQAFPVGTLHGNWDTIHEIEAWLNDNVSLQRLKFSELLEMLGRVADR